MVDHSRQFRVRFVRWGECSLPLVFILSIHANLSLAFAFTLGIHLKATTKLISNLLLWRSMTSLVTPSSGLAT